MAIPTSTDLRRSTRSSQVRLQLVPWLAPAFVAAIYLVEPGLWWTVVHAAIPALFALAAVLLASRRPERCLFALLAFMPFQLFVPAWLYASGVPVSVIRPLTGWREVLGLAIVVAALRQARSDRRRLSAVDKLALAYVIVVAAYALFPKAFYEFAPDDSEVLSLAFRASAGFVVLLLACRHAPFDGRGRALAERGLRWGAVAVSGFAVWEFFDGDGWNRWAVETVQVTRYQIEVLDSPPFNPADVRVLVELAGREFVRVSSLLNSPLTLGHYLLLPFALVLERAMRGKTATATAQAVLIGAALLFTQTRSALLGAAIIIAVVLRRSPGRTEAARARFWVVLVGVSVAVTPLIVSADLLDRFGGDEQSDESHEDSLGSGIDRIVDDPLGTGLGTSAGVGQRFYGAGARVSENYYLQVGGELGVIGLVSFVALVISINRGLRRARDDTGDAVVAGVRSGFLGICIAAFFLHAFSTQVVAWTAFGLAGLALGAQSDARARARAIGANIVTDPSLDRGQPTVR